MTSGELKFALQVEMALNRIPQPEYRQLMVEAMMVLTLIVENDHGKIPMDYIIQVDKLVYEANEIFIKDQVSAGKSITVKPRKCEHLGTRAKAFTLGGDHISEVFS